MELIAEKTAIALQQFAAWESSCSRMHHKMLREQPEAMGDPNYLSCRLPKIRELYELARHHADRANHESLSK